MLNELKIDCRPLCTTNYSREIETRVKLLTIFTWKHSYALEGIVLTWIKKSVLHDKKHTENAEVAKWSQPEFLPYFGNTLKMLIGRITFFFFFLKGWYYSVVTTLHASAANICRNSLHIALGVINTNAKEVWLRRELSLLSFSKSNDTGHDCKQSADHGSSTHSNIT